MCCYSGDGGGYAGGVPTLHTTRECSHSRCHQSHLWTPQTITAQCQNIALVLYTIIGEVIQSRRRPLQVKALVGAFNQAKALVGAFSVIVKTDYETDKSFYSTSQNIEPM